MEKIEQLLGADDFKVLAREITSVAPLAKCHTLVQINIFGNEIRDPQTITDTDIIMNYDPTYSMPELE